MDEEKKLATFLNKQRLKISKQEGYLADGKLIPWHQMASDAGMTEPTMMRIAQARSGKLTYDNVLRLARYLPDGWRIFEILSYPIPLTHLPHGVRWLLANKDTDPEARRLLEAVEIAYQNSTSSDG